MGAREFSTNVLRAVTVYFYKDAIKNNIPMGSVMGFPLCLYGVTTVRGRGVIRGHQPVQTQRILSMSPQGGLVLKMSSTDAR